MGVVPSSLTLVDSSFCWVLSANTSTSPYSYIMFGLLAESLESCYTPTSRSCKVQNMGSFNSTKHPIY